jgi:quinol-cytochrome oxidoreductase complex cytochrome b subunit
MKDTKDSKELVERERYSTIRQILGYFSLLGFVYGPLDERLSIREALEKALKKPVPEHVNWFFCFGGITFFCFIIQVVTGILLLMHYRPTAAEAYASVVHITNNVPFGWLIRGLHFWASTVMIIMIFLHMLRVYFYGAYKPPRDFNWIAGIFLLMITLGFGFTGYLLPWHQVSYWATTVGTEIPGAVPIVGDTLKLLMRGSADVSQVTLTRFFAMHILLLPAGAFAFLGIHFAILRRQGISGPL